MLKPAVWHLVLSRRPTISGRLLMGSAAALTKDEGCGPSGPARVAWLVINLDRSPDRWAAIAEDLGRLGLGCQRVPAVDGALLTLPVPGIDPDLFLKDHGRRLLPGEMGCHLSHLRALATFLDTDASHAMILEDDAVLSADAVSLVEDLVADDGPDDWDLVKFEAHHRAAGLPIRAVRDRWRLCAVPFRAAGSAAYLVKRSAAATLLRRLVPMRLPYDVAFERGWDLGLRVRSIAPLPVRTRQVASTIDRRTGVGDRRRVAWTRRFRVRALNFASALHAYVFPTATLDLKKPTHPEPESYAGFDPP